MKKVNYLLGLVLLALLCADGFVVGQGMTFYPAITSDEQSALLIGAVQTNDTRVLNFTNAVTIGTLTVPGVITSTNAVNAPIKAVTGSSQTNLTFWTGSAASYAALASTNASTIYFITN